MKRILSIDWDYFINATATQRCLLFPDGGNENISYYLQDFIWNSHYRSFAGIKLKSIGILKDDYFTIQDVLRKFACRYPRCFDSNPNRGVLVTVSHRWIYDFVMQHTTKKERFEIYNVDFHHDMYDLRTKDEEVNCGNWVNCLKKKRHNMKYFWIPREDSEDTVLGGEPVPCEKKSLKDLKDLDFDFVFICRSDCWSPPHLDKYFEDLWKLLRCVMPVKIEQKVHDCRDYKTDSPITPMSMGVGMKRYPNSTCAQCGELIPEGSSSIFCDKCNNG